MAVRTIGLYVMAPRFPADRRLRWGWPLAAVATAIAAYGLSLVLGGAPGFAERVYGVVIFPLFRPLSLISSLVPFGVFDVLVIAYAVWLIALLVHTMRAVMAKRRRWWNAAAGGLRRTLRDAGVVASFFYVVWGFNYARPSVELRFGWDATLSMDTTELVKFAEQAVAAANQAYIDLHGSADVGQPTAMPADVRELDGALEQGWERAVDHLQLPSGFGRRYGRAKFPWSGPLMSWLGIAGVYVPFTAETYLPAELPAISAASTMAHEKAHQRGVAREAEATFLGSIAGALAPHPLARYGAASRVASQLLSTIAFRARADYDRLNTELLPGIHRDIEDRNQYYRRYRNVTQQWHSALNDRYLRANRVRAGTRDYGRAATLLLLYAREHGTVLPDALAVPHR